MADGVEKRLAGTPGQVTVVRSTDPAAPGIVVKIQPGKDDYPGVTITPPTSAWDLSSYGHVEAKVVNMGTKPLYLSLRVDDSGDWRESPSNTESISLPPGQAGTLKTIFGYSFGYKPGHKLKPSAIVRVLLFASKSEEPQSFRIESLVAGGPAGEKPPVAPEDVRIQPMGGRLIGRGVVIDPAKQIASEGPQASLDGSALKIVFPPASGDKTVSLRPVIGRWDLRAFDGLQVRVRNAGTSPIVPRVRLDTNGGPSEWVGESVPLRPGAARTITLPFAGSGPFELGKEAGGTKVSSDAASALVFTATTDGGERTLVVESVQATKTFAELPAWLGKRPPVPGDWTKTLGEEFNGRTLDPSIWSVYGENYWDKPSHWSKHNVTLGNGVVKLRYEKKRGHNNDDPTKAETPYASGYLHTYGLWVQRYGYFEARMKMPTAPGLWPAFWMMPDRGVAAGEQWQRQDTANGGMEFDIMEHLTRWGPHRFNIAMHYDGYGKDHKGQGTDKIYAQTDKDGFVTCGLLWTPGSAIYYYNGREVARWESPRISNVPSILMFTLPSGGWDNSPLEDARLPDHFTIDYVRVWQRKDLSSAIDGKPGAKK
jgi:beta-glucanase (GH16 family)